MSNHRIMTRLRLFRWIPAFALILTALPLLLACGSAHEPIRERESRTLSTLIPREFTPAPTARPRSAAPTRAAAAPTRVPFPRATRAPAPTRASAPARVPTPTAAPKATARPVAMATAAPTPAPTRAPTPTPIPEGWVLTESEAIHRAAYSGEVAEVERLLDRGADTGAQASLANAKLEIEAYSLTPLHLAAGFNPKLEVAELLMEWGANVEATDYHGRTPLHWAAWNAEPASVEQLLEWGANLKARAYSPDTGAYNWTPLHFAAARNPDAAVVELLLEWGADIAAYDDYGATALHRAVQINPNTDIANFLLEHGANIEASARNNETPLHHASWSLKPAMASLLLNRGANIEAQGYDGRTPLHWAALMLGTGEPAVAMVKMLLDRDANIEALDHYNRTPLLLVVQERHNLRKPSGEGVPGEDVTAMIEALLDRGANIEAQRDGWTPLLWTAYHNQSTIAEFLLDRGADSKATNNDGQTPCQVARQRDSFTGTPLLGRLCRP